MTSDVRNACKKFFTFIVTYTSIRKVLHNQTLVKFLRFLPRQFMCVVDVFVPLLNKCFGDGVCRLSRFNADFFCSIAHLFTYELVFAKRVYTIIEI